MRLLPLFIFWGLWFLNFSTRTVFSPILPLIEDSLSLSHGEAGGLFTSLGIGYSLTVLIVGRFAPVWGYRRTVVSGFIGIGLVLLGIQWAKSYFTFHLLFFLLGVTSGAYLPSILPIITATYDHKDWGKAIGFHDSAASLSFFSIPILVAIGLHFLSWRRILFILSLVALLFPIYFWKVSIEPKREASPQNFQLIDLFRKKTILVLSLFFVFAGGISSGIYYILPLYLIKERGIDFHFANTLFGISRAGGIIVPILIGFLLDRYGYRKIMMLSLLTAGLSTVGLSLSSTSLSIVITLILQATLSLTFFPVGFATISHLTSPSERSMTLGVILFLGGALGVGGIPFILGLTADHFSFQVGIFWLGVLTAFSSLGVRFLGKG
jgi:NNP family nitrate/nitrite transporter-like MFS transporter